jgi:hypothetical protein
MIANLTSIANTIVAELHSQLTISKGRSTVVIVTGGPHWGVDA